MSSASPEEGQSAAIPFRTTDQTCCWHRYGDFHDRNCREHYSMRAALQDSTSYEWPGLKRADGTKMFEFRSAQESYAALIRQRRLGMSKIGPKDRGRGVVEQRCVSTSCRGDRLFRHPVAVKDLKNKSVKEVKAMTDLRHPHIALFLATFTDSPAFRYIVTFPAGCCDLRDFMLSISEKIEGRSGYLPNQNSATRPDNSDRDNPFEHPYQWPYNMDLKGQLCMLRRYFVCLCQALDYLHSPQIRVRHKDIKPENIIIDLYGNVILIDFSISRKFKPENPQLRSLTENEHTDKYRTPENDMNQARDGRSDIWQLGCVFLEMVSLLFKISLSACENYCSFIIQGSNGAKNTAYVQNDIGISRLLNDLQKRKIDSYLAIGPSTLTTIRAMLSREKDDRPFSRNLWMHFDFAGQGKCPDCHPNSGNPYSPTVTDQHQNEAGVLERLEVEIDDVQDAWAKAEGNEERRNDAKKTLEMLQREYAEKLGDIHAKRRVSSVHDVEFQPPKAVGAVQEQSTSNNKENQPPGPSVMHTPTKGHPKRRASQTSSRLREVFSTGRNTGGSTDRLPRSAPQSPRSTFDNEAGFTRDETQKSSALPNTLQNIKSSVPRAGSSTPPLERRQRVTHDERGSGPTSSVEFRDQPNVKKRNTPPIIVSPSETSVAVYSKSMGCLVITTYDNIQNNTVHFKLPHKGEKFSISYKGKAVIFNLAKRVMESSFLDAAREFGIWVECSEEDRDQITLIPVEHPDPIYPSQSEPS